MPVLKYRDPTLGWTPLSLVSAPPPSVQIFTASGTWTKPAGALYCVIELTGGGGAGGGNGVAAVGTHSCGSGGSSGGYSRSTILATQLGATEVVTVGTAGVGVSAANGGQGTPSSFGSWVSAVGGNGGLYGAASAAIGSAVGGGIGTGTTAGDITMSCNPGGDWYGDTGYSIGGYGGSNPLGTGGRGGAGTGVVAGSPGTGYGAGGGGSVNNNTAGTAQAGGNGSPGVVIVTTYYGAGGGGGVVSPSYDSISLNTDASVAGSSLPRGALSGAGGYAQITADSATTSASTTTVYLTAPTVTLTSPGNRRYRITTTMHPKSSVTGDRFTAFISQTAPSTVVVMPLASFAISTINLGHTVSFVGYHVPAAGSVTYSLGINRISGTGTITVGATAGQPTFIAVEDVGPA